MLPPPETVGINTSRSVWIDTAKGIAILLVLLSHSGFWDFCKNHAETPGIPMLQHGLGLVMASFMPVFYYLSGYTYKERPGILRQRFKRLIFPYALWGGLSLLIAWGLVCLKGGGALNYLIPAVGILYSRFAVCPLGHDQNILLFPVGASPLWFLTSLFTSYICFLFLIRSNKHRKWIAATYLAATLIFSFLPILLPWSLDTAPAGALFLYAGYLSREKQLFKKPLSSHLLLLSVMLPLYLGLAIFNGNINMSVRTYGSHPFISPLLFIIIGILGSYLYCIFSIFLEKSKLAWAFAKLGQISLTLMCSHTFVFCFLILLSRTETMQHIIDTDFLFIGQIMTAIAAAFLLTKCHRFLKKRLCRTQGTLP